jgi:predicted hotdog family 3-hydroxylacyl-ACP dehydratase
MSSFPPVAELVPHSGPMCLLSAVRDAGEDWIACDVDASRSAPLADPDGSVGAHVAIEWLAQAIAAHGGLVARERGLPPPVGFLLGARRLSLRVARFAPGERLLARAHHVAGQRGLVVYDCALEREGVAEPVVQGRINVFVADDLERLLAGATP